MTKKNKYNNKTDIFGDDSDIKAAGSPETKTLKVHQLNTIPLHSCRPNLMQPHPSKWNARLLRVTNM